MGFLSLENRMTLTDSDIQKQDAIYNILKSRHELSGIRQNAECNSVVWAEYWQSFSGSRKKIKHMSVAFGESDLQNSNAPELGDCIGYIQDIGV